MARSSSREYFCGAPAVDVPSRGNQLAPGFPASRRSRQQRARLHAAAPSQAAPISDAAMRRSGGGSRWTELRGPERRRDSRRRSRIVGSIRSPRAAGARGARRRRRHAAGERASWHRRWRRPSPPRWRSTCPARGGRASSRRGARALPATGSENDADSVWIRIGPGPLRLTEIQFHPRAARGSGSRS